MENPLLGPIAKSLLASVKVREEDPEKSTRINEAVDNLMVDNAEQLEYQARQLRFAAVLDSTVAKDDVTVSVVLGVRGLLLTMEDEVKCGKEARGE